MFLRRILFISLSFFFLAINIAQAANENPEVSAETPVQVAAATYPKTVETDQGTIVVHHPQIEDWKNFKTLTGWMAMEVTPASTGKTWIGSALIEAQTSIDFDERLVVLHDLKVIERKFPDGEPPGDVIKMVQDAVSLKPRSVVLDVLLRALPEDFEIPGARPPVEGLSFEPPKIYVSETPTRLMIIDGEPIKA